MVLSNTTNSEIYLLPPGDLPKALNQCWTAIVERLRDASDRNPEGWREALKAAVQTPGETAFATLEAGLRYGDSRTRAATQHLWESPVVTVSTVPALGNVDLFIIILLGRALN